MGGCFREQARSYALIAAFRDLTGVPMVLNTSFDENEPVVCKPEEALDCVVERVEGWPCRSQLAGELGGCFREQARSYALIDAFRDLTGVPMVLNTSFDENEPVACKPEEALDCFLRTRMDVLVLGNWVVERVEGLAL